MRSQQSERERLCAGHRVRNRQGRGPRVVPAAARGGRQGARRARSGFVCGGFVKPRSMAVSRRGVPLILPLVMGLRRPAVRGRGLARAGMRPSGQQPADGQGNRDEGSEFHTCPHRPGPTLGVAASARPFGPPRRQLEFERFPARTPHSWQLRWSSLRAPILYPHGVSGNGPSGRAQPRIPAGHASALGISRLRFRRGSGDTSRWPRSRRRASSGSASSSWGC